MKKQKNRQRPNQKKAREKSTQRVTSERRELPRSHSASLATGLSLAAALGGVTLNRLFSRGS